MQSKNKCKDCVKSRMYGFDKYGEIIFGCQELFCIYTPVEPNKLRKEVIDKFKEFKNGKVARNY